MPNLYIVSIGSQNNKGWVERERWNVLTTDDQEAIYRVWRATPTNHFDEIRVVGMLLTTDKQHPHIKLNQPTHA